MAVATQLSVVNMSSIVVISWILVASLCCHLADLFSDGIRYVVKDLGNFILLSIVLIETTIIHG